MSTGKILNEIKIARQGPNHCKENSSLGRLPNVEYRTREYLTEREVERLMKAAGNTRTSRQTSSQVRLVPLADSCSEQN
jgi:hypothetical protein